MAILTFRVKGQTLTIESKIDKIVENSVNYLDYEIIYDDEKWDSPLAKKVVVTYDKNTYEIFGDKIPSQVIHAPGFTVSVVGYKSGSVDDSGIIITTSPVAIKVFPSGAIEGTIPEDTAIDVSVAEQLNEKIEIQANEIKNNYLSVNTAIAELEKGTITTLDTANVWELEAGVYYVNTCVYYATPNPPVYLNCVEMQSKKGLLYVHIDISNNTTRNFYLFANGNIYFGTSTPNALDAADGVGSISSIVADIRNEITSENVDGIPTKRAVYNFGENIKTELLTDIGNKADRTEVETALLEKVNKSDILSNIDNITEESAQYNLPNAVAVRNYVDKQFSDVFPITTERLKDDAVTVNKVNQTFISEILNLVDTDDIEITGIQMPPSKQLTITATLKNKLTEYKEQATDAEIYSAKAVNASLSQKATNDEVSEIKSDLTEIIVDGKNLFDRSKIAQGYLVHQNTGAIVANAFFNVSDFIKVTPNTNYTISVKSLSTGVTAQIRYFHYDANKAPIQGSGAVDTTGKVVSFTSPENAEYIRFSYVVYSSGVMLEEGATATEYEEYRGKYINPEKIDSYTKEQSDTKYCAIPEIFKINLPEKIYATVGIELNIYFDNIVDTHDTDYSFDVTCDKGMHLQRCYRYTPNSADVGSYPITLSVTNNHGQTVEKTSTIIVTAETISPEKTVKILILGDSTTAGGITVEKIHTNFENTGVTIQTLGTRGIAPYNHEGRSGWLTGTYLGYEEVGGVPNAFYNNGFDAQYYFSKNNIDFPDWFIINLGINDMFPYTKDAQMNAAINNFIKNINTMIASIKSASSSIKIGIALPIPPNYSQDAFGKAYKCVQTRMRYKRNNFYLVNKLIETYSGKENTENIYLIPIFTNLDTVNNMGFEEIKVNARNTTTYKSPIGNGGVHPVESGYWQTADVYTSFIKANLNN